MHAEQNRALEVSRTRSRAAHEGSVASALLGFGAVLLLLTGSWAPGPVPDVGCASAHEVESDAGWTTRVECGPTARAGAALRGPARLLFGQTLDLNRADAAALEVLPRIGPRRAAAIVAAREQERFASVHDLARIPGIGPRTVEGLAGWASVEVTP